jgi:tRNA G18 (ribose-2'-O)-methylase SpoU
MQKICLVAIDVRSTHNVGAFFRTADAFSASVCLVGVTPYPKEPTNEKRLPHIAEKAHAQIAKTALGAEQSVPWRRFDDALSALHALKAEGYQLIALEQAPSSLPLQNFISTEPVALIVGEEVSGLSNDVLMLCDKIVEIPMSGTKESLNVSVAAGIGLYQLRYGK